MRTRMSAVIVGALILAMMPAGCEATGDPPVTVQLAPRSVPGAQVPVGTGETIAATAGPSGRSSVETQAIDGVEDGPSDVWASFANDSVGEIAGGEETEAVVLPEGRWRLPLTMRPLSQLSPDAARFVAERGGAVTAGVYVAQDQTLYVSSPETALPMASVAKVVIMLAALDRAEVEGRGLEEWELAQLEPMVVWSDNDAATLLWDDLGGAAGVDAYLAKQGVTGIVIHPYAWGDSRASGPALAWLLGRMAFGDLLTAEHRDLALALLERAALDQSWGVATAALGDEPEGAIVASKDGWYPADAGWRAGSVGLVLRGLGETVGNLPYSIAVLTAQNALLDDGIATVDGLASRVYSALAPR